MHCTLNLNSLPEAAAMQLQCAGFNWVHSRADSLSPPFSPLSLTVAREQSRSLVMFFVEFHCGQFQCLCFLFACFILVTKKASSPHEGTCIIHAKLHQGEGGVRTVVVSIRIGSQSENGHLQAPNTPLANILTPPQCVASLQSRPSESEKLFTNTRSPTCHPRLIGGRR